MGFVGLGLALALICKWPLFCVPQAVEMFLNEEIGYLDICKVIEACCDKHQNELILKPSLDEIVHYDDWSRDFVRDLVHSSAFNPTLPTAASV
jgi:hypothetical protein